MPNHVHLILTPTRADGLGLAVGEAPRRYTNFINARGRWTGHLSCFADLLLQDRAEDFAALRRSKAADARSALQSLSRDLSACLADRSRADLPAPNQQTVPAANS